MGHIIPLHVMFSLFRYLSLAYEYAKKILCQSILLNEITGSCMCEWTAARIRKYHLCNKKKTFQYLLIVTILKLKV